jgi:hypothetical protein
MKERYPVVSLCDLICARQRELFGRYSAIRQVCSEDGGTVVEDVQLGSIVDELDVLADFARAELDRLSATPTSLTHPPHS